MTYRPNVFSGTLNRTQSINQSTYMISSGLSLATSVDSGLDTPVCQRRLSNARNPK